MLAVLLPGDAHGQAPLELEQLVGHADLAAQVSLLRDPGQAWTLADVRAREHAFAAHDGSPLTFGMDSDALWLRFSARNRGTRAVTWFLEVAEPTLDRVDAYVLHADGRSESMHAGNARPFAQRSIQHANTVFEQTSPPGDEAVYYVRASGPFLRAPLHAWTPRAYDASYARETIGFSICLGALLLVALYQLGIFCVTRQMEVAAYALASVCLALVMTSLSGLLAQLVLPHQPTLVIRAVPVSIALAIATLVFFVYAATSMFDTATGLPRVLLRIFLATLGVLAFAMFGPRDLALRLEFGILLLVTFAGPYLVHLVATRAMPQMGSYALGWYALIVTVPITILRYAGVWPDGPMGPWLLPSGFVVFGGVNSLGLAAMASHLRGELGGANRKLLANVQQLEEALAREKEASETAQRATAEANRATRAKDEFMATMSHELRTPLNAIINIPQGLLEEFAAVRSARCTHCHASYLLDAGETIDAATRCEECQGTLVEATLAEFRGDHTRCFRFLQKVERSGQHLLQMVNGLLDYSKLEAGRFELALARIELDGVLREAVDQMVEVARPKDVHIELHEPTSGSLVADALRLKQVLINLLDNAIKFSEPKSVVRVRCESTPQATVIEVQDHGIGIAPEDHARIFASFEQVYAGDTRKYGGTGLGLSISRSLVRMHGGELTVRSALGQGSTFVVHLPHLPEHRELPSGRARLVS